MSKTFVIGDIHGCHEVFCELLGKIGPHPTEDMIILLGDYIDRGPASKQVVSEIIALKKSHRVIALLGNHEKMFLDLLAGAPPKYYLMMGGGETLTSYGISDLHSENIKEVIPPGHLQFLNNLLPYWEDEENIYVHAGIKPGRHLTQQSLDHLLWIRDDFLDSDYDFGKRVIFGHTPFKTPRTDKNKIGLDTGAVYGGDLTCLVLPDLRYIKAKNRLF